MMLARLLAFLFLGAAFAPAAHAIAIQQVTSPGGITAWLVEDHSLPIVTINLAFRGGAALDPDAKAGLADLATDLLDEGAGELDSNAFHAKLEDMATSLSFAAGEDTIGASMRTITANLDASFDLLRLSLTAPRFDADAVARVKRQVLASIAHDEHQPRSVANRLWRKAEFGDHPYARRLRGTAETIGRIDAEDLHNFVRERFAKDVLIVGVVGDIAPDPLKALLDKTFGGLPAHAAPGTVPPLQVDPKGELLLARLDVPQSVVVFGQPGIKRDDPDWYAALLVNDILGGGGFSARLTREVREKRGLAYSVYSALDPFQAGGAIIGSVGTENARVAQSIDLIRAEWKRMRDEGPTAKELADAKTYLTGSFPLSLDSTGRIAAVLVVLQRDRLGIDYLARRNALIDGVSLADAKRVARRLLDPAALTFVVVGAPPDLPGAQLVDAGGSGARAASPRLPGARPQP
ncbi:MAG TPA: pitrilysin family protein [Stellaceae bacterium]|nr:pitrilysin family protein [Stellaceae bacterium]